MAKVLEGPHSLLFTDMSAVGAGLVNDFLRSRRKIEVPNPTPGQREIEWSTPEEKQLLVELAKKVESLDIA